VLSPFIFVKSIKLHFCFCIDMFGEENEEEQQRRLIREGRMRKENMASTASSWKEKVNPHVPKPWRRRNQMISVESS
jgi:hypothetical protein